MSITFKQHKIPFFSMKSQTFLEFMNELWSKMLADIFCSSVFFISLSLPIICINSFRKS